MNQFIRNTTVLLWFVFAQSQIYQQIASNSVPISKPKYKALLWWSSSLTGFAEVLQLLR